jgi:hypothetical protein
MIPLRAHHFGQSRPWSAAVAIVVCLYALGLGSNIFALPDSVSHLIKKLKDKNTEVRVQAAMELGRIQDPRAVEPLIAALKDKDDSVKSSAAAALGSSKDLRAVEPLITALQDTNYRVRDSAVVALGLIQDPRAVEPLIAALQDRDPEVRTDAAQALEKMNDTRAAEPLRRFAADSVLKARSEYVIAELKPNCPGGVLASNADITIEAIGPGSSYVMTSGRLAYLPNGQSLAWCSGARHTIKGRLETGGYTFISDPTDPLVFRLSDRGYVYERGKGTVLTPSNENVLLQPK